MNFCHRNGLWIDRAQTQWVPTVDEVAIVPRSEAQLLQKSAIEQNSAQNVPMNGMRKLGFVEDENTMLWKSGVVTAEAVATETESE